jgi:hypothetical protein
MVDEVTQTELINETDIASKSKIPIRTKSPKPVDAFFDHSIPKRTPRNHVSKQSALHEQKQRLISPDRTPKTFSYTIPFSSKKTPKNASLLDTPRKTPKSSKYRGRSPSPTKSYGSRNAPAISFSRQASLASTSNPPLQPPIPQVNVDKPPIDGVYGIVESFLNGPILSCLSFDSWSTTKNVFNPLDDVKSVLTDLVLG